ncbi:MULTISPECIES: hypothetical protein [Nocardia]|uniref:hypothetical protein n=1 Tax=Nocardia TaxID=1817 RepID=UPI0007EC2BF9|nr:MULTISPECIES: hypothetical protein [Nocardia]MBF6276311.1 hypothetical protein [Nocardia nova]OBA50981.1 hypothetical protein A5789_28210 [Nocardia sp. 852002-51101_SCH5132738]OBF83655.1 hypothetical protein A9X06_16195 [Mycobacterium sp. 852002-51759_SCH5129042]
MSFGGVRGRNQVEMDAAEQASDDDRCWFEANPWAYRRVRVALPDEFTADMGHPCPPDHRIVVSVEQIRPDLRVRNPLAFVPLLPGHDELTELQIADVVGEYVETRRANGLPDRVADEIRAASSGDSDSELYPAIYQVAQGRAREAGDGV